MNVKRKLKVAVLQLKKTTLPQSFNKLELAQQG